MNRYNLAWRYCTTTGEFLWVSFKITILSVVVWITGCAHTQSDISVKPASDHITAIQGNLSAVDAKTVVVEQWLKSH
jgi:pectin methylesterase-like acyl-CoA thioesterase